ncbi:MAG: hypothetical protein OEV49_04750 [candidate division Zixibacteria bacterium]|nr:hypothetical protein [candidate division Zixibacteria bacterium]MDH3938471.1 hypothetical protein [candidate division Zixibacteria bacterium]MDH4032417.1 hypothetical protein [candidate division Zixibacteria bacterium]
MKRTIFVSALVLTLLVALSGEAFSRSAPWSYASPSTGDDHTWGGDNGPDDGPGGTGGAIGGGWIPADMIITDILFKWLGFSGVEDKNDAEADHFIQGRIQEIEPTQPVNTNFGGNQ